MIKQRFLALSFVLWLFVSSLTVLGQAPAEAGAVPAEAAVGTWALYPIEADTEPPPPPPIYASYRKNEPPLEQIPRVVLELKDGKLQGKAVFAKGILSGTDGGDVAGQPEIALEDIRFAEGELTFKATVEGETFEAKATLQAPRRNRFEGTWKAGQRQGRLFLNRR